MPAIAHRDPATGRSHDLREHLEATAARAAAAAACWPGGALAGIAGLWHDLGKYAREFQEMLAAVDPSAHLETVGFDGRKRVNHSSAGAQWAAQRHGGLGPLLAYIIAGHHAGLPDWSAEAGTGGLSDRLRDRSHLNRALDAAPPADILDRELPAVHLPAGLDVSFWTRMLFSAVCDADFLDTEAFFAPERAAARLGSEPIATLADRLEQFLERRFAGSAGPVNAARAEVLACCREKAASPRGLFSLTVPTGGGKTYASLAFALEHARRHGLRRVVYAIPYTSIIEQTADAFRAALGPAAVLEHHSNLDPDPDRETHRSRLAAENWDAPVVVTTTVQLFESLFAARPSRCRKLHNLAEAVIVLDEVQLLPPDFLKPILYALQQLVAHYGTTVLLSTATQPALARVVVSFAPREIIENPEALFRTLQRVRIACPEDLDRATPWPEVADALATHDQVLAIVNTRSDCRALHALLPEGSFHLSTYQCAAHRSALIAAIRRRLADGAPVRTVSTQLIEAGVDLDFPIVWRALAGLESIAQAAGRCNREGRLDRGEVVVFVPERPAPPGHLRQAEDATRAVLRHHRAEGLGPTDFEAYFKELYSTTGEERLDKHGIMKLLQMHLLERGMRPSRPEFQFRTAAERFRMIADDQVPIVVPYGETGRGVIRALDRDPDDWRARRAAQRFLVPIRRQAAEHLAACAAVEERGAGLWLLRDASLYREDVGLLLEPAGVRNPEELIA